MFTVHSGNLYHQLDKINCLAMQPGRQGMPGHVQRGTTDAAAGGSCCGRIEVAGGDPNSTTPCLDYGGHSFMAPSSLSGSVSANPISDSWSVTTSPHSATGPFSSFNISQHRDFTSSLFPDANIGGYSAGRGYSSSNSGNSSSWNMTSFPGSMAAWPPSVKSEDLSGDDSQSTQQDYYYNTAYTDQLFPHTANSPGGDEERSKRRREQNKMAAQRCRQRRRQHIDELVKELQSLECDNTSLTYEIHQLRKEKSNLEMTLGQHNPSCQQRSLQTATLQEVNEHITSSQ